MDVSDHEARWRSPSYLPVMDFTGHLPESFSSRGKSEHSEFDDDDKYDSNYTQNIRVRATHKTRLVVLLAIVACVLIGFVVGTRSPEEVEEEEEEVPPIVEVNLIDTSEEVLSILSSGEMSSIPVSNPTEAPSALRSSRNPTMQTVDMAIFSNAIEIDWIAGFSDPSAQSISVEKESVIRFSWSSGIYDVWKFPDKDSFERCDFESAVQIINGAKSPVTYTVTETSFFSSKVGSNCVYGQKLMVTVIPTPMLESTHQELSLSSSSNEIEIDWIAGFSDSLARSISIEKESVLRFSWRNGLYNVWKFPDKESYDTCDFESAIQIPGGGRSPVTYTVTETSFFACQIGSNCVYGQNLMVTAGSTFIPELQLMSSMSSETPTEPSSFQTSNKSSINPSKYLTAGPTFTPTQNPTISPMQNPTSFPLFSTAQSLNPTSTPSLLTHVISADGRWGKIEARKTMISPLSNVGNLGSTTIMVDGDDTYNGFSGRISIRKKQSDDDTYSFLQEIVGQKVGDRYGRIVTISSDGSTIVVGTGDSSSTMIWSVLVYRWQNEIGLYKLDQKIDGENVDDHFGISLSVSSTGNMIVVGAVKTDYMGSGSGSIYVYTQSEDEDDLSLHSRFDGKNNFDNFGRSVAISPAGTMIVASSDGTSFNDTSWSGSVYVYVCKNDGSWYEETRFDGELSYEYLGKLGLEIEATKSSMLIHAEGRAGVRTYDLSCNCADISLQCTGLDQYPSLSCILPAK